jgi:acetoin utilization deacetylase AcuC-like enzyme
MRHEPGGDHPESPKRLMAVMDGVRTLERHGRLSVTAPRPATEDQIRLGHTSQYLDKVRAEVAAGRRTLSTGDTDISAGSFTAALAAAGIVVSAVDAWRTVPYVTHSARFDRQGTPRLAAAG